MKKIKIMFYCQHILGMGHLVRSMEIVRGLVKDFQVCFINGGEIVQGFDIPSEVEIINLPAIKTDSEFQELQVVDSNYTLGEVQSTRKNKLLEIYDRLKPDIFIVELFPFGRKRFSFELIPLLEKIKQDGNKTKVVSSLRDIVVTKQDQTRHEAKVCKLINQYFDLLLIHGDPNFQPLEATFSRVKDLNCEVHYTGYVVQPQPEDDTLIEINQPIILVSIGGGRFGHELLDCVLETAPLLENKIPHQIQIFTGPFMPEEKLIELQTKAAKTKNIKCDRYTPNLLNYMKQADLSISMAGYNTTMNILTTGVRAIIMAFTGNDDQEQRIRAQKLSDLGVLEIIDPQELQPEIFAEKIINSLQKQPEKITFNFNGVTKTATLLNNLVDQQISVSIYA
jgi:predicted glycosyltransferase